MNKRGFSFVDAMLIVAVVATLVVGALLFFSPDDIDPSYLSREFVTPEKVSLYLNKDEDSMDPFLYLSVNLGGGCDDLSDLEISQTMKEGTMFIGIEGYTLTTYSSEGFSCSGGLQIAGAKIDIKDFIKNGGHQFWFRLADEDSRYSITQTDTTLRLEPVEVTNVISHESGTTQPKVAQPLEILLGG